MIYAGFPSCLGFGWRTGMFQLSGFYCHLVWEVYHCLSNPCWDSTHCPKADSGDKTPAETNGPSQQRDSVSILNTPDQLCYAGYLYMYICSYVYVNRYICICISIHTSTHILYHCKDTLVTPRASHPEQRPPKRHGVDEFMVFSCVGATSCVVSKGFMVHIPHCGCHGIWYTASVVGLISAFRLGYGSLRLGFYSACHCASLRCLRCGSSRSPGCQMAAAVDTKAWRPTILGLP